MDEQIEELRATLLGLQQALEEVEKRLADKEAEAALPQSAEPTAEDKPMREDDRRKHAANPRHYL